ncbi:MAG TPA: aldehyde dehydrogenase family protein [Chloroflexota bacterium]|nr:aldehyde dehydrogenase family protein [Chloroflexota bacterium]
MTDTEVAAPFQAQTLIDGRWIDGTRIPVRYPYDGSIIAEAHETPVPAVNDAVENAWNVWQNWRREPAHARSSLLARVADLMSQRSEEMAEVITWNTGKLIRDSRSEVARAISTTQISSEETKRISGEIVPMDALAPGAGKLGFAVREPLGVIAGVTPFNAPLGTLIHKLGPALAAGNTLVLKPHPHGSAIAALLGEIVLDAGLPAGAFNIVHGGVEVGRALTTHPKVAMVNFTGSGRVAEQIVREIGLKRTVFELGGNAPTIVHDDADLERAVPQCVGAAFALNGQSCVSTQRIYVQNAVYDDFLRAFVAATSKLVPGDPFDPNSGLGPVIDEPTARRIESWINEAVAQGAQLAYGGVRRRTLLDPTIVVGAGPDMKVVCDEVFGPVVTILRYETLDEALAAANDTPWGLKSGIFTSSLSTAIRAARELEYGTVNINGPSRSRVDHEPSGGAKLSGWGTEGPSYAIEDMTRIKMVSVAP